MLALPEVDDIRPPCCPKCGAVAVSHANGKRRVVLQGNGRRSRSVVLPATPDHPEPRQVTVWARRFECQACGAAPTVLPEGVVPGHLYSLMSMIASWVLAASRPVGDSLPEREVGKRARVGGGDRRWRSPARWARSLDRLLPMVDVPADSWRLRVHTLLVALASRAGSLAPEVLLPAAVRIHSHCGGGM